jgi:hypothetical protein
MNDYDKTSLFCWSYFAAGCGLIKSLDSHNYLWLMLFLPVVILAYRQA